MKKLIAFWLVLATVFTPTALRAQKRDTNITGSHINGFMVRPEMAKLIDWHALPFSTIVYPSQNPDTGIIKFKLLTGGWAIDTAASLRNFSKKIASRVYDTSRKYTLMKDFVEIVDFDDIDDDPDLQNMLGPAGNAFTPIIDGDPMDIFTNTGPTPKKYLEEEHTIHISVPLESVSELDREYEQSEKDAQEDAEEGDTTNSARNDYTTGRKHIKFKSKKERKHHKDPDFVQNFDNRTQQWMRLLFYLT